MSMCMGLAISTTPNIATDETYPKICSWRAARTNRVVRRGWVCKGDGMWWSMRSHRGRMRWQKCLRITTDWATVQPQKSQTITEPQESKERTDCLPICSGTCNEMYESKAQWWDLWLPSPYAPDRLDMWEVHIGFLGELQGGISFVRPCHRRLSPRRGHELRGIFRANR